MAWRENPRHQGTSPFTSHNCRGRGVFGTFVDVAVLGATEVDVNFNANAVNCLLAKCTALAVAAMRDRIPVAVAS